MKRTLAVLLSAAALLAGGGALSAPRPIVPARVHRGPSVSVGSPTEGHLKGGLLLEENSHLRFIPGHQHRWGLPQLVRMLERSASRVQKRLGGSALAVGDLSRRGGGDVVGHHSHESGRDADIGFYVVNSAGKSFYPGRLVTFDEDGKAPGKLRFDDARNWALVESWLNDPQARVSHIFVATHLRDRLLAYARGHGVSPALRNRAAMALMQPKHGLPHDNHFHVRIACPNEQRGTCVEYATREHHPKTEARRPGKRASKAPSKAHPKAPQASGKHPSTRPVIARARKRVGTSGDAPPSLVAVVPAPNDIDW